MLHCLISKLIDISIASRVLANVPRYFKPCLFIKLIHLAMPLYFMVTLFVLFHDQVSGLYNSLKRILILLILHLSSVCCTHVNIFFNSSHLETRSLRHSRKCFLENRILTSQKNVKTIFLYAAVKIRTIIWRAAYTGPGSLVSNEKHVFCPHNNTTVC